MKTEFREQALKLRIEKQLGYSSISKIIPVSKSTLSLWLKDYPLSKERISEIKRENLKKLEARIEKFRDSMKQKRRLDFEKSYTKYKSQFSDISKESRLIAGLMLYLAEGSKKDDYHVALANTDHRVIKFFMKWASEFLDIPRELFKFQLHLYPNMDINKEVSFWIKELNVDGSQFYKNYISKLKNKSFSYKESFRHGTCTIYCNSSELKRDLKAAIQAFIDSFLGA